VVRRWKGVYGDVVDLVHCNKKPCRNARNSDVDNGDGAELKYVGVGIFRHPHRLVFYSVVWRWKGTSFGSRHRCPHRNFARLFLQCGLEMEGRIWRCGGSGV
jgi:hypothetical protein